MKKSLISRISIFFLIGTIVLSIMTVDAKAETSSRMETPKNITLYIFDGKNQEINLGLLNNDDKLPKYSSSNKKVASVSNDGLVSAKKAGKVKITTTVGKSKWYTNVIVKKLTKKWLKKHIKTKFKYDYQNRTYTFSVKSTSDIPIACDATLKYYTANGKKYEAYDSKNNGRRDCFGTCITKGSHTYTEICDFSSVGYGSNFQVPRFVKAKFHFQIFKSGYTSLCKHDDNILKIEQVNDLKPSEYDIYSYWIKSINGVKISNLSQQHNIKAFFDCKYYTKDNNTPVTYTANYTGRYDMKDDFYGTNLSAGEEKIFIPWTLREFYEDEHNDFPLYNRVINGEKIKGDDLKIEFDNVMYYYPVYRKPDA